ncbi:MAG: SDR family oxidoreductase [Pseudomonadales bacterium]|nr:SDR family oxidoreductase [Pseudomonadales bacterium]
MAKLEGKTALITGASSGSGTGIARRFIEEGANVVMTARGKDRLIEAATELGERAVPLTMDVGNPESVNATFQEVSRKFGKLDILINNAAVYRPTAVEDLNDEEVQTQLNTNFLGAVHTCRAAIPLLRAAGGGDIINTSSESTGHPFPLLSIYVSTKAALEMFSRVLAMEVRKDNIRVTNLVQGTASGPGEGSSGWAWTDDERENAFKLWGEMGLLNEVYGKGEGQSVDEVGEVHLFIVTRPRSQQLDTVWCRSF